MYHNVPSGYGYPVDLIGPNNYIDANFIPDMTSRNMVRWREVFQEQEAHGFDFRASCRNSTERRYLILFFNTRASGGEKAKAKAKEQHRKVSHADEPI